jgi:multidrug resistance efflux pump
MIGVVVVAWTQYAPMSGNLVTSQYVVQLVPYNVKGYVKKVYAKANEPLEKGNPFLEIDPAPYQYTVNQVEAQLRAAQANVKQSQASLDATHANASKADDAVQQAQSALNRTKGALANARSNLAKWKAAYELAKTEQTMAINLQRVGIGAISKLKVDEARQRVQEQEAAVNQAEAGVTAGRGCRTTSYRRPCRSSVGRTAGGRRR